MAAMTVFSLWCCGFIYKNF